MDLCIFNSKFIQYINPRINFLVKKYIQIKYKRLEPLWILIYIYVDLDMVYEMNRVCLIRQISAPSHLFVYLTTPTNGCFVRCYTRIVVLQCFQTLIEQEMYPSRRLRYAEVYHLLLQVKTKVLRLHHNRIYIDDKMFDFSYKLDNLDGWIDDEFEFNRIVRML